MTVSRRLSYKWLPAALCTTLMVLFFLMPLFAQEGEETYSISLTKTPEVEDAIYEVENKKVLTETYTVKEGDWIWQMLRERGLLDEENLAETLSILKKLNKSLANLSLIHPGETIIIPLKITPVGRIPEEEPVPEEKVTQIAELKDVRIENYTVRPGDTLYRVLRGQYEVGAEYITEDYLDMVKRLNPAVEDPDLIYPGQVVRLPVYSPEIVRKPIEPPVEIAKKPEEAERKPNPVAKDLSAIFMEMGEEWVQAGEHFIPLKSEGQINLSAESFPVLNLRHGQKVIVDIVNGLPQKVARLIELSWENYHVVRLTHEDDLRAALEKILPACEYPRLFWKGETLLLEEGIPVSISADWIAELSGNQDPSFVVINLFDASQGYETDPFIKSYLEGKGVRVIDYPHGDAETPLEAERVEPVKVGDDPAAIIETVLNLTGRQYSAQTKIPVYRSEKANFKLVIKADFFLQVGEKDAIIDVTGLTEEEISLLEDHQFLLLSLPGHKNPLDVLSETVGFLGIQYQQGPHVFMAGPGNDTRHVKLSFPGIVFQDTQGQAVLGTPLSVPDQVAAFLSRKGYKVLSMTS